MRASARLALALVTVTTAGAGLGLAHTASAGGTAVNVVVLKEHGVGTAAAAQPYLDQFIALAAQPPNNWAPPPASSGKYTTTRADADAYIKSASPHYGIFSLPAFLAMRRSYNLQVVGEAKTDGGGEQYFIVSVNQGDLGSCKGKKLATDHMTAPDDQKFIEKVVAAGAFTKGDFQVTETRRFGQAGRALLNGDVDCALIHEAQLAELQKLGSVKTVWSSAKLPGMPVVAFPSAPAGEKSAFQQSLPNICQGGGAATCKAVGLLSINSGTAQYQSVIAAYP